MEFNRINVGISIILRSRLYVPVILSVFLALLSIDGLAQTINLRQYTVDDGLPQSYGLSMVEDKNGYLWISTADGISKYDGKRFTTITHKTGISENYTYSSFIDDDGNIWFGHQSGAVSYYHVEKDSFSDLFHVEKNPPSMILCIAQDEAGLMWFGTRGHGIYTYDGNNFIAFGEDQGLRGKRVQSINRNKDGRLWILLDNSISLYDPKSKEWIYFEDLIDIPTDRFTTLTISEKGDIWIGTSNDHGLFIIRNVNKEEWSSENTEIIDLTEDLGNFSVRTIFIDNGGIVWVGSRSKGVLRMSVDEQTLMPYSYMWINDENGLTDNTVWSITEDREGSIWLGTFRGLNQYRQTPFQLFTEKDGLTSNTISAITEGPDGRLWIGTNEGVTSFNISKGS